jgi:hypothetical protein
LEATFLVDQVLRDLLVVVQLLIVKCAIKQTKETRWNFIIYFA